MDRYMFESDFRLVPDNAYPDGWECEQNCEKPFLMGAVIDNEFCILFKGNKHIPLTVGLKDFSLQLIVRGDRIFGEMGLEIHFRYDPKTRAGWCLRYDWGIADNKTNRSQRQQSEYVCELFRYNGLRTHGKYESFSSQRLPGAIKELSIGQPLHMTLNNNMLQFAHCGLAFNEIRIPSGFPETGSLALDQSHSPAQKGAHRISSFSVETNVKVHEIHHSSMSKTEFPAWIHRMVSPYYYHTEFFVANGVQVLRMTLTGGPSKDPVYPDIDRERLNEKLTNPYVRIENGNGVEIGKYLLVKGTVGLAEYNWNVAASAMSPADHECPIERKIVIRELPGNVKLFIGYENYISEDSLCSSGGSAEALIDASGNVLYAGIDLTSGSVNFSIDSPPDKQICDRIPKDIPFYEQALSFARRNHFFVGKEDIRFKITIFSRDPSIAHNQLNAVVNLEDVFGESLAPQFEVPVSGVNLLPFLPNGVEYSTGYFNLPVLKVGVYHLRVKIRGAAIPEQRRAFEVMPENPKDISPPMASGLPELYPNIISGICGEHFHPWGSDVSDICHYNSGGNNYFKVARKWRAPELLHVYGRKYSCWLKPWCTVFEERGIEPNIDLIKKSDSVHKQASTVFLPTDCWGRVRYTDPKRFDVFLEFLQSKKFKKTNYGVLSYEAIAVRGSATGLTPDEYDELVRKHWKEWIGFVNEKIKIENESEFKQIKAINPECELFTHGGTRATYASGYKLGYFSLFCGRDLRAKRSEYLTGSNGLEDYPYSSGYPIAHGICHLAAAKLEDPNFKLFPEVFGINGETLDPRVTLANPPLGQSDPPFGFLTKQFYEYSFAAVWFNEQDFHFWHDHGYKPKTWDRENYQEMLYAYSFISKIKPVKPLRTSGFVYSRNACLAHPDYNEVDDESFVEGSVINTAEEAVAFAYEEARIGGQMAGFFVKMEDVASLDPLGIDMLVIPPLCGVSEKEKLALRNLHEKGVGLFGFEDASGLEDLFGISSAPERKISVILPGNHPAAKEFDGARATANHELLVVRHDVTGSQTLLQSGEGLPVLIINKTQWGQTAFFTLPPTLVERARNLDPMYGQRTNSDLIKTATRLAMRIIGDKQVETSAGTLIGFSDECGAAHVIVSEDRCPEKGKPIRPLVRIKLPGIKKEDISSDKSFEIAEMNEHEIKLRFALAPYESARINIRRGVSCGWR